MIKGRKNTVKKKSRAGGPPKSKGTVAAPAVTPWTGITADVPPHDCICTWAYTHGRLELKYKNRCCPVGHGN